MRAHTIVATPLVLLKPFVNLRRYGTIDKIKTSVMEAVDENVSACKEFGLDVPQKQKIENALHILGSELMSLSF